jgi:hypothetical protein
MHIGRRRGGPIENSLYTPRPQCKKYDKRSSDTMILNFVNAVYDWLVACRWSPPDEGEE